MKNRGPKLQGQSLRRSTVIPDSFLSSVRIDRTVQAVPKEDTTVPVETTTPGEVLESVVDIRNTDENQLQQLKLAEGETFPVLIDRVVDDEWEIPITIEKSIVSPNDPIPEIPPTHVGEVERQSLDRWASIQLTSKVSLTDLPDPQTIYFTQNYQFPNILVAVGVDWDNTTSNEAVAEGVLNTGDWGEGEVGENASWSVSAQAGAGQLVSGAGYAIIKKGLSGALKARLERSFVLKDEIALDTIAGNKVWDEVYGELVVIVKGIQLSKRSGYSGRGDWAAQTVGGFTAQLRIGVNRFTFGPVIHNNVSLSNSVYTPMGVSASATGGSKPGGGTYPSVTATANGRGQATLHLPSSSTPPPHNNEWVLVEWEPKPWRWGIWVLEKLYIQYKT